MINWSQLQIMLAGQNISIDNQRLVRNFLNFYPLPRRQQLMGVFLNLPKKITFFIELLKKKKELAKNSSSQKLLCEIMDMESGDVQNILNRKTTQ